MSSPLAITPKKTVALALLGICFSLVAHADHHLLNNEVQGTSTPPLTKAQLFTLCSQEAIEKRDTSLAEARSLYNTKMNALLAERKESEKRTVAIEDEKVRKNVTKESVEKYKNEVRQLQNNLTQLRKSTWQTFEEDTDTCRSLLVEEKDDKKNDKKETVKKEGAETKEGPSAQSINQEKTAKESFFGSIKSLFNKDRE